MQLARLQRMQFGKAFEKLSHEIAQLELALEELEAEAATASARQGEDRDLGSCRGCEVRPSPAALPPVGDDGRAGYRYRSLDARRLGRSALLDPGRGKTATGKIWAYVVDDRASGSTMPPLVWYQFTLDRTGSHPQQQLANFTGFLQTDGDAGYEKLYNTNRVTEVACWAHFRRKIFDPRDQADVAYY